MMFRRIEIAFLLSLLLALDGCATDGSRTTRFRFEALESRCGVPTIKQLTALPSLPPLASTVDSGLGGAVELSPVSVKLAKLLGIQSVLDKFAAKQQDQGGNAGRSSALLWQHQQVMDRISLASFDVISTVIELDCEEKRADHVADGLTEVRQDKQEHGLFYALVGDALIGVVAGSLSLVNQATAASASAILGGVLAMGIGGASTIFLAVEYDFFHSRNHLAELWESKDESPLFPDLVWRYLTIPHDPSEGTIRSKLIARWQREGRFGNPYSADARRRKELLLGTGGVYGIRDLRVRAEMLNHLKSAVLQMGQDLNVLMYEIMVASPYPETAMIDEG